jgi:hypothetical protein
MKEPTPLMLSGKIKSAFRHRKNRKTLPSKAKLDTKTTQILLSLKSEVVSEASPHERKSVRLHSAPT